MRPVHIQVGIVLCVLLFVSVYAEAQVIEKLIAASDAAEFDNFGTSVAISGNLAVVGSPNNMGVTQNSGSAYVFNTTNGSQRFKFTANDGESGDLFGDSVAISGNLAIVGAPFHSLPPAIPVDPHLPALPVLAVGSAYVFNTFAGNQQFEFIASDAAEFDNFGTSVAISGNFAVVGSPNNMGVVNNSGSAYVFNATNGSQRFKFTANDGVSGDNFGTSVAISGNLAVIGADRVGPSQSGSAYVFDAIAGHELFKLSAAGSRGFGTSVAISGNLAIVGANNSSVASGAAYIFDLTTGNQLFKLTSPDNATASSFGTSVGISGNLAIVAADGDGVTSGASYVFDLTTGIQLFKLAIPTTPSVQFGFSAAISNGTAVVGVPFGNSPSAVDSGAAYIFNNIVPEPATLSLLALGGLAMLCRRD